MTHPKEWLAQQNAKNRGLRGVSDEAMAAYDQRLDTAQAMEIIEALRVENAELLEALRAMLSEYGRTVEQAIDDVPLTQAEALARAAITLAEGGTET